MPLNIRVPLEDTLLSRDTTTNKDTLVTNCFSDTLANGEVMLVKRPGLENLTSALGLGQQGALGWGRGIFYYEGKLYSWNGPDLGLIWAGFGVTSDKLVLLSASPNDPAFGQSFYIDTEDNLKLGKRFGSFASDGYFGTIVSNGSELFSVNSNVVNSFLVKSLDGISWTIEDTYLAGFEYTLSAQIGTILMFLNEGASASIVSLDNGVSFTEYSTGLSISNGTAIATLGSVFSVGNAHTSNGTTWSLSTGAADAMGAMASNGTIIIGVSMSNVGKISANGTSWNNLTFLGNGASSMTSEMKIVWSGSKWVGVCKNGNSVTSTDGITWTLGKRKVGKYLTPKSLVFFNNVFYCYTYLADSTIGNPYQISYIETSLDGINWNLSAVDLAFDNEIPTIISGNI
jgi:hypothetical protein